MEHEKRILMVVGNGLAIDFSKAVVPDALRLVTSQPLGWDFTIPEADNRRAFDVFTELCEAVQFFRELYPDLAGDDFGIIEKISCISGESAGLECLVDRAKRRGGLYVNNYSRFDPSFGLPNWD